MKVASKRKVWRPYPEWKCGRRKERRDEKMGTRRNDRSLPLLARIPYREGRIKREQEEKAPTSAGCDCGVRRTSARKIPRCFIWRGMRTAKRIRHDRRRGRRERQGEKKEKAQPPRVKPRQCRAGAVSNFPYQTGASHRRTSESIWDLEITAIEITAEITADNRHDRLPQVPTKQVYTTSIISLPTHLARLCRRKPRRDHTLRSGVSSGVFS
jgi:hypothetical protein